MCEDQRRSSTASTGLHWREFRKNLRGGVVKEESHQMKFNATNLGWRNRCPLALVSCENFFACSRKTTQWVLYFSANWHISFQTWVLRVASAGPTPFSRGVLRKKSGLCLPSGDRGLGYHRELRKGSGRLHRTATIPSPLILHNMPLWFISFQTRLLLRCT